MLGIRADLFIGDKGWEEWTFPQSVATLRKWTTGYAKIIPSPEKGFKRKKKTIKIKGTATVFIVRSLGITPVTTKH